MTKTAKTTRLNRQEHHLHVLSTCPPKCQKSILAHSKTDLIECLCDCALNILKGNVPLTAKEKKNLIPFLKTLYDLSGPKSKSARKRILLNQKGGFLSFLIKPVLSLLGGLFGSSLNGK